MNPMKRLGLVALFVVLGTLFATSLAVARDYTVDHELVPPAVDPPEPKASGKWTLTYFGDIQIKAKGVDVSCKKLTPGEQYSVVVSVFWSNHWGEFGWYENRYTLTADARGKLETHFLVYYPWEGEASVEDLWIEKLNENGSVVVLETQR